MQREGYGARAENDRLTLLLAAVAALVVVGSLLAMAEASMTRLSHTRSRALVQEGRRNATLLERIEADPPRYLNSVYLSVMFAQNGSAVLVAVLADRTFSNLGITFASLGFTLVYFVLVEAMSKTFGVLHSDRVALALSPLVLVLSRIFTIPVRLLIGLANVLLPGKGLKQGPFVSAEDIRQMAQAGQEAGSIESGEKELIYSVLELGETMARDVMVPRPDTAVVEAGGPLEAAIDVMVRTGHSRLPVYESDPDNIVGIVYVKDLIRALAGPAEARPALKVVARPPFFVPETIRIFDVLREMQLKHVQMAIVTDEHGDVAGLLTLEDIVEEIVGDITDEDDIEERPVVAVGPRRWRVLAKTRIREFNELVGADLEEDADWQTVGGLVSTALAKVPEPGDEVTVGGFTFRIEQVSGRRIGGVLVVQTNRSASADTS